MACIEDRRDAYRVLVGKPEGKGPLGRRGYILDNNIKMYLKKTEQKCVEWIDLVQDGGRVAAVVNTVMNITTT